ncbi:glycosyltransferase [Mycolicibacterium cosmeticum]|uniref:glycosyltransferase n=1 Tax=Mycolicibacterium cosmeticum TaxID=258533 RepID=UPI0032049570
MTSPGVVILGMHRSGTSAITRMVNLLGVPTCPASDLIRDRTGNVRGHWESATLVRYNEDLFRETGAAWWCPPPLDTDWKAIADRRAESAAATFASVHHTPSWVWKDPRTCVTAPFWRAVLQQRLIYLLVVRHPAAVAASLTTRNSLTTEGGIALWEGYTARAARVASGAPTLVCSYEAMITDPRGFAESAREFLSLQGVELDAQGSPALAARFAEQTLAHHRADDSPAGLSDEQACLLARMAAMCGPHDRFDPDLPPVTTATEELFDERRAMLIPEDQRRGQMSRHSGIELLRRAQPHRPGQHSISVLVVPRRNTTATGATVDAVRRTAPESTEIVVVGAPYEGAPPHVTLIDRPAGGRVEAINAALQRSSGGVVILCDGTIEPEPGWAEALCEALKRSDAGAVGPALVHGDGQPVHGLSFADACLNVSWTRSQAATAPFPVAAVPATMMAMRREVLDAVGGFDSAMMDSGGEDTELCVRLWRAGYVCLAAPHARAAVRPGDTPPGPEDPIAFLHNRLRLGALHLSAPRLRRFLEPFRRHPHFAEAFARVVVSDLGRRRAFIDAIACFDDGWFLNHFNLDALEDPSQNRTDHELVQS